MPQVPAQARFERLVEEIGRLYIETHQAQVRFAWETGRHIVEEEQHGDARAGYGQRLLTDLARALTKKYGAGFSKSNLEKMRHFYVSYPIASAPTQLDWSDYLELLPVKDHRARRRLEARAVKEGLTSRQIRRLVRQARGAAAKEKKPQTSATPPDTTLPSAEKVLPPLRFPSNLKLHTFGLASLTAEPPAGHVWVDCGFFVRWPVKKEALGKLDFPVKRAYTCAAVVERVVDGDTLIAVIEAGFGIVVEERLRLRGINCPELGTPEGKKAKAFVQGLLPPGSRIVVKTHKDKKDIYGRFVADVFYRPGVADAARILEEPEYLNQILLDSDHAARVSG